MTQATEASETTAAPWTAAVIGGGPAGLIAAEILARAGVDVTIYDQMPSVGRKLLMAGRGGLNLTHAEPLPVFLAHYGTAAAWLGSIISAFPPDALIAWCNGLGQPTFTGSSARVFPVAMKAAPLLRAWLRRLAGLGVRLQVRHRWVGWDAHGNLRFDRPDGSGLPPSPVRLPSVAVPDPLPSPGWLPTWASSAVTDPSSNGAEATVHPDVTILALGGASWPRLGSDAGWTAHLPGLVTPFQPTNCGFLVDWSPHFRSRFAGRPLKRLAIRLGSDNVRGEAMITAAGLEGGIIYALSARLRDTIQADGSATIRVDLRPDLTQAVLADRLGGPRRSQSLANTLRKQAGLTSEAIGLVQEALHSGATPQNLPLLIKSLPIRLLAPASIERAISSAGGLQAHALDTSLMLRDYPGVFAAGEMLDWEAPTGGYLLQACFSTGIAAANGALVWLGRPS